MRGERAALMVRLRESRRAREGEYHGGVRVDVASLVALRIGVGLGIAAYAMALLFAVQPFDGFMSAPLHLPYRGLEWVVALPPNGLRAVAVLLVLSGVAMAAGWRYRITAPLGALLAAYLFFVDSVYYDSVAYLAVLLLVLLAASPAHCIFSFDARAREKEGSSIACRGARTSLMLIRFQVACVYVFAGIAKCYPAWIHGRAMEAMSPDYALARWLAPLFGRHGVYVAMSWAGLAFDLAIALLVLWPRTRRIAFAVLVAFHVHNAITLPLGAVPWVMIGVSTILLEPDWPRRIFKKLPASPPDRPFERARLAHALVAAWVVVQLAIPLRRWVTPGDPLFTEVGYDFTWALRSRVKDATTVLMIFDATGKVTTQRPFQELGDFAVGRVMDDPYLIWLSAKDAARGRDVRVKAVAAVRLNGGKESLVIDRDVDLTRVDFPLLRVPSWVRLREE
jgi:hypothetical protein